MKKSSIEQIRKGGGIHLLLALLSAALVLLSATQAQAQARIGTDLGPMLTGSPNLTIEAPLAGRIYCTFNARAIGMQGMEMPRGMALRTGMAARPIPALSLGIGWGWSRERLTSDNPELMLRLRHTQGMAITAGWRLRLSQSIALEPHAGIGKYRVTETVKRAMQGYTNDAVSTTGTITSNPGQFLPLYISLPSGYGLHGGITFSWAIPQEAK